MDEVLLTVLKVIAVAGVILLSLAWVYVAARMVGQALLRTWTEFKNKGGRNGS